jgi:hypothetical protein
MNRAGEGMGRAGAAPAGADPGGGSPDPIDWTTAMDVDFTAEASQTLVDGNVTLGGKIFYVETAGSQLFDVLLGTGVRVSPIYGAGAGANAVPIFGIRLPDVAAALAAGEPFSRVRAWFLVDASSSDYVGNKSLLAGMETHRRAGAYDPAVHWGWWLQTGRNQFMSGTANTNIYAVSDRDGAVADNGGDLPLNADAPDVIVCEFAGPQMVHLLSGVSAAGAFPAFAALKSQGIAGIGPAAAGAPFSIKSRLADQDLAIRGAANYPNGANDGGAGFVATFKRLLVEYV